MARGSLCGRRAAAGAEVRALRALAVGALMAAVILAILTLLSGCIPPPFGFPHEAGYPHDENWWRR
jgi:hypothetical protein